MNANKNKNAPVAGLARRSANRAIAKSEAADSRRSRAAAAKVSCGCGDCPKCDADASYYYDRQAKPY